MRSRRADGVAQLLRRVPLFRDVPEQTLKQLALSADLRIVGVGRRVVAELESGDEVLVVLRGSGKATIGGLGGDPPLELAEVGVGDCIGEMALFTGELRSATVTTTSRMLLLAINRARFEALLRRHPGMAAYLADVLATRYRANQRVLATVLNVASSDPQRRRALLEAEGATGLVARRPGRVASAARIAWRELVVRHRRELPFLMLTAFVTTLVGVRGLIYLTRQLSLGISLETLLRVSYVSGIWMLCVTGTASLLYFRPGLRRTLALNFGVGLALLLNALPVLLTFDLFYRDMVTPDPHLPFSIDVLYDRTEGANLVIIAIVLLFQAAYLQRFYRRVLQLALGAVRRSLQPA
jgi:CRP-like cAMP-binding protein